MPAPSSSPIDSLPPADSPAGRILRAAHQHLFSFGYSMLTMDALAHELGMSKKTLYAHFPTKESMVGAIVDLVCQRCTESLEAITADSGLTFTQKLCAVIDTVGSSLANASPAMLRNLQRFAPAIYQKIEDVRQRNVPLYFGRLIREGQAVGMIRQDIDPDFAALFWLQAIRGLIQPDVLDRLQLTPKQTLVKAIDLYFGGLLTPAGRKDYEKHLHACEKHARA